MDLEERQTVGSILNYRNGKRGGVCGCGAGNGRLAGVSDKVNTVDRNIEISNKYLRMMDGGGDW